jgi:hypothetical protein
MASAAEGTFAISGPITFPLGTESTLTPFAVYVGNAALVRDFNLVMPEADGRIATWTYQVFKGPPGTGGILPPLSVETGFVEYPLRVENAVLSVLAGTDHDPFVGIYPDDAKVAFVPRDGSPLQSQSSFAFGNAETTGGEDPRTIWYYVAEDRPNLYLNASGQGRYEGRGIVKVSGLELALATGESSNQVIKTGWSQVSATEFNLTVLTFDFTTPATLTFDTGATTVQIAAADARSVGEGTVSFVPIAGQLQDAAGDFLPPAHPEEVHLDGRFMARTLPLPQDGMAEFVVSGEVEPSGFVFQPSPTTSTARALSWLPLVLLGAVLLAGVGGLAAWRTRRRPRAAPIPRPLPAPTAEQPAGVDVEELAPPVLDVDFAMRAATSYFEAEEWERALSWFRYAKGQAPTSARLAAEIGFCLTKLGRYVEAEESLEEAYRRGLNASDLWGVVCSIEEAGHPVEKLEHWLKRLLQREPRLLWQVEEDFQDKLRGRPSWATIKDETLRRLEDGFDPKRS